MLEKRSELKKILMNFQGICHLNKIWYVMDAESLLGVVRHSGFIPWEEKIQVMMTIESFEKLKDLSPQNVVDMSFYTKNKNLTASFVYDKDDISSPQPYIQIRILIPTSVKKVYKYKSMLFWLKNKLQNKSLNLKNSINYLYHKEFQGYYLFSTRKKRIEYGWIQALNFKFEIRYLNDIKVPIPVEYKRILKKWYGDYKKIKYPKYRKFYISPLLTKTELF